MKYAMMTATVAALCLTPMIAQANTKPGNCAIYAEMTADTVQRDARTQGGDRDATVKSLTDYAKAQAHLADAQMEQTYEQSKAFGWDKTKVDNMIAETEAALRAGFHTSTMDQDKIYMDHVMAINQCAMAAKSADELGQPIETMRATLQQLQAWAQS